MFSDSERQVLEAMNQRDIDPRDFGRLEAEVTALQKEVSELRGDVRTLLELANKGRGGFWVGMSIASMLGGVVTWFASNFWGR